MTIDFKCLYQKYIEKLKSLNVSNENLTKWDLKVKFRKKNRDSGFFFFIHSDYLYILIILGVFFWATSLNS